MNLKSVAEIQDELERIEAEIEKIYLPQKIDAFFLFDSKTPPNDELDAAIYSDPHKALYCLNINITDLNIRFGLSIGYSNEWINVYALSKRKTPSIERFGYHLYEKRWSYGEPPANPIPIKKAIHICQKDIEKCFSTLNERRELVNQKKELDRYLREQEEKEILYKESLRAKAVTGFCVEREKILTQKYLYLFNDSISFGLKDTKSSVNKLNKIQAYDWLVENKTNLKTGECDCIDYKKYGRHHFFNDVRSMCRHRFFAYRQTDTIKELSEIESYAMYHNSQPIHLIHKGELSNGGKYIITINHNSNCLNIVMPKVKLDGFVLCSLSFENGTYIRKGGSIVMMDLIHEKLEFLFKDLMVLSKHFTF